MTFSGAPDAITLGSDPDTIEYALEPSSGVETIANFILGQDELNVDLGGAPRALCNFTILVWMACLLMVWCC